MNCLLSIERRILNNEINEFCKLTNDHNPIHLKKDFALNSGQKDCVVNGALTLSFAIGYLMENTKNSDGALILETKSLFKKPIVANQIVYFHLVEIENHLNGTIVIYSVYITNSAKFNFDKPEIYLHKHFVTLKYGWEG